MERKNRPRGSVKKTEVLEQRISREFREGNLQHVTVVLFSMFSSVQILHSLPKGHSTSER